MRTQSAVKKTIKIISELTEGVFSNALDASLWFVAYFGAMSMPQSSVGQIYRANREADKFMETINYEIIKQGIKAARREGLLKPGKSGKRSWPIITAAGKERLNLFIPKYREPRAWDERMYLVTYDIPEKKRRDRDLLRSFIRTLGCAKLQESVYLTPYDPRVILKDFVRDKDILGTIIVSDIGKDGSIGDSDLTSMLVRVYNLENINERYLTWLNKLGSERPDISMMISYSAILKDDPQLPFALLPKWWKGDKAYKKVKPFLKYA